MNPATRLLVPFLFVFVTVNIILALFWGTLAQWGINNYVLFGANIFIMLLCLLVFFIQKNAIKNANPNVFVRSIMSGMLIKMFACVGAVLVYTLASGDAFNKKSVFISMILYLVYLAAEVIALTKLNKKQDG